MSKQNKAQKRSATKPRKNRDLAVAKTRTRKLAKMARHMVNQPGDFTTEYAMQCQINDPI